MSAILSATHMSIYRGIPYNDGLCAPYYIFLNIFIWFLLRGVAQFNFVAGILNQRSM